MSISIGISSFFLKKLGYLWCCWMAEPSFDSGGSLEMAERMSSHVYTGVWSESKIHLEVTVSDKLIWVLGFIRNVCNWLISVCYTIDLTYIIHSFLIYCTHGCIHKPWREYVGQCAAFVRRRRADNCIFHDFTITLHVPLFLHLILLSSTTNFFNRSSSSYYTIFSPISPCLAR